MDGWHPTWRPAWRASKGPSATYGGSRIVPLSLPDTTIAAVALANDLMLVTGNLKDFPMPELRLYPLP